VSRCSHAQLLLGWISLKCNAGRQSLAIVKIPCNGGELLFLVHLRDTGKEIGHGDFLLHRGDIVLGLDATSLERSLERLCGRAAARRRETNGVEGAAAGDGRRLTHGAVDDRKEERAAGVKKVTCT